MGRRHGGRGHRVSPKLVRQRRAAGIRPKRGHNFDRRQRHDRDQRLAARELKALPDYAATIDRMVGSIQEALREDAAQELWVMALEGASERELQAAIPSIRNRIARLAWGGWGQISLDAPFSNQTQGGTWADVIDQDGRIYGGAAPLPIGLASFERRSSYRRKYPTRSEANRAGWTPTRRIKHGRQHRGWWNAHPEARVAMAEKNRRMWAAKAEQISIKLQQSGQAWWNAHPEARAERGEIMRQAWARRRARQEGVAA